MIFLKPAKSHSLPHTYLNEGNFIDDMGLFEDNDARSAWVRAKTECEMAEISYSKFREISENHPEFIYSLGRQMAKRLRNTTRKVRDLAFLGVNDRVTRTLLDLSQELDTMTQSDGM